MLISNKLMRVEKPMNMQEMFDVAVSRLLSQECQSSDHEGVCMYRGDNGAVCAVGALIKDEFYNESLEENTVNTQNVMDAVESSLGQELHEEWYLLTSLQSCHDCERTWTDEKGFNQSHSQVLAKFNEVAAQYSLKPLVSDAKFSWEQ
jgi:hypothetical protein